MVALVYCTVEEFVRTVRDTWVSSVLGFDRRRGQV